MAQRKAPSDACLGESTPKQPIDDDSSLDGSTPALSSDVTMDRGSSNTLRITNLSENTQDDDLRELFRPFGQLKRCYLGMDDDRRKSKGFAYVSYYKKEHALAAIAALDGQGTQILDVGRGKREFLHALSCVGSTPALSSDVTMDRGSSNTLRITNLSENTQDDDLRELFRPFGQLKRCYLGMARRKSKRFAYVSYYKKEHALAAIAALDGQGLGEVRYLVEEAKQDCHVAENYYGQTPIHVAAEQGHLHVVRFLMWSSKADPNKARNDGSTPLRLATRGNHTAIADYVCSIGAKE